MKRLYRIDCSGYISGRNRTAATNGLYTSLDAAIAKNLAAQYFGPGVGCECRGGIITEDSGVTVNVAHVIRWPHWLVSRQVIVTHTHDTTENRIETVTVEGVEYSRTAQVPATHTHRSPETFVARICGGGYLNEPGDDLTRSDDSIDEEIEATDDALAEAFSAARGVITGEGGNR